MTNTNLEGFAHKIQIAQFHNLVSLAPEAATGRGSEREWGDMLYLTPTLAKDLAYQLLAFSEATEKREDLSTSQIVNRG